jgi:hypothetical protein
MLDGTMVPSCTPGDSLCTCDDTMSQEESDALALRKGPPTQSPLDKARALYLGGDKGAARNLLEGRVFGHMANVEEVRFLKDICKEQGDQACGDKIKQMYP